MTCAASSQDTPSRASQRNPGCESSDSPYIESGALPVSAALPRCLRFLWCWRPDPNRDVIAWSGPRRHVPQGDALVGTRLLLERFAPFQEYKLTVENPVSSRNISA
ncbi:hypothetical protein NDU88_003465 [Pleurodeles waltl]|uniref:Uncharacterized protein n=1 Tax=Pleurodeles waltl TaxID=8319 RepID=A0AAV7LIY5_PLEWA|nr:hypothetical protein NDU88_003465 [Pleurodeles waltl]